MYRNLFAHPIRNMSIGVFHRIYIMLTYGYNAEHVQINTGPCAYLTTNAVDYNCSGSSRRSSLSFDRKR